ncbi:MAG: DUF481 domain-containing protein [Planctomycetota bacterium]|nr:DUF481 domain-containing protein [Planctomycetota bacterium]
MRFISLTLILLLAAVSLPAQEGDRVVLKDGSLLHGEVESLSGGKLKVKTGFSGTITIELEKVSRLEVSRTLPFRLEDGAEHMASAASPGDGQVELTLAGSGQKLLVDLATIQAITPAKGEKSTTRGTVNFGGGATDGNTRTKSVSFNADLESRFDSHRLSAGLAYNYAEDLGGLTARNSKARLKYDYFLTGKLFLFGSVLGEEDSFQDLNLRTALAGGPGYQFVEAGDLEPTYLKGLAAYGEIGLSYVDEDFLQAGDKSYLAAKWSLNTDWKILPRLSLFHHHEGYPSLADMDDFYITTETGIRVSIFENFVSTLQVNWRWDNSPSPGFGRSDTNYLLTLGYTFDL